MNHRAFRFAAAVCVFAIAACSRERRAATIVDALPAPGTLASRGTLVTNDDFVVSSAAGLSDCSILLAGSGWGTVVKVNRHGATAHSAVLPGPTHFAKLGVAIGDRLVYWGSDPDGWGVLNTTTLAARTLPVPAHHWGGRWVGPATPIGQTDVAFSPVGAMGPPRRRRTKDREPLVFIADSTGRVIGTRGEVADKPGQYLSWLASRVVLGAVGDTILVVNVADATLRAYRARGDEASAPLWTAALPRYVTSPTMQEEVRRLAWIQVGDLHKFVDVPQIAAAAFAADGRLFAVRTTKVAHSTERDRVFALQGAWAAIGEQLDVYDRHGARLGSYSLPITGVTGVRADGFGRLLLVANHAVAVVKDPAFAKDHCPELPSRALVEASDRPPLTRVPTSVVR